MDDIINSLSSTEDNFFERSIPKYLNNKPFLQAKETVKGITSLRYVVQKENPFSTKSIIRILQDKTFSENFSSRSYSPKSKKLFCKEIENIIHRFANSKSEYYVISITFNSDSIYVEAYSDNN